MSTDPTALVNQLTELSDKNTDEILEVLKEIEFFKPIYYLYKMRNPKKALKNEDFKDRVAEVAIADGYNYIGDLAYLGHEDHELFQYLENKRENAGDVPFVFRDDMFDFVAEFLNLAPEEVAYIEMKLALSEKLKERRRHKKLTQAELAKVIESSQSRVAKMEAGDPTVSIDLLVKSLLALGVSKKELGQTIS